MNAMIDCSDVVPAPKPANFGPPTLPAGKTHNDIEQAVSAWLPLYPRGRERC